MEGMVELPGGGYDLLLFKDMAGSKKRQFEKTNTLGRPAADTNVSEKEANVEYPIVFRILEEE